MTWIAQSVSLSPAPPSFDYESSETSEMAQVGRSSNTMSDALGHGILLQK